jgi:hypothetical protein
MRSITIFFFNKGAAPRSKASDPISTELRMGSSGFATGDLNIDTQTKNLRSQVTDLHLRPDSQAGSVLHNSLDNAVEEEKGENHDEAHNDNKTINPDQRIIFILSPLSLL